MTLSDLGWNDAFEQEFAPCRARGWQPARLVLDHGMLFHALTVHSGHLQRVEAVLRGRLGHKADTGTDLPVVGDWVGLEFTGAGGPAAIQARLHRQNCLSRRATGETEEEQVIAANLDIAVLVTEAGADFNERRLERYFALITRCGAKPMVLLNKADLFSDRQNGRAAAAIQAMHADAEVIVASAKTRRGLKTLRSRLTPGTTAAFLGSSGVGKSAIVNRLLRDDRQWTGPVNEITGKGRHTTTAREIHLLPGGGLLMDNPGFKEVQTWTSDQTLRESFSDIEALAQNCQFDDCQHGTDTGCALRGAVAAGNLGSERLAAYLALGTQAKTLQERRRERTQIEGRRKKLQRREKSRERPEFGGEREDDYKQASR